MVIVSSKWKFFRGIVITFPAVFYIFLGIFSARMHKISHEAKPSEKFYAWRLRKCQEKCRKQLEKCWQFQGKIGTCETALPHVRILFSVIHAFIPKKNSRFLKELANYIIKLISIRYQIALHSLRKNQPFLDFPDSLVVRALDCGP